MSYVGKVTAGGSTHLVGSTLYGTCSTAAATAAKVVTCAAFDKLETGVTIHVKFDNSNTASTPTLNVNSTGAKNIYKYGTTKPGATTKTSWNAGSVVSFTYDGSAWQMNDHIDDTDAHVNQTVAGVSVLSGTYPLLASARNVNTWTDGDEYIDVPEKALVPLDIYVDIATFDMTLAGGITASSFNGHALAAAADKSVDTSISVGSTSTNLPTTAAVAAYVTSQMGDVAGALVYKGTVSAGSALLNTALQKGWYYIVDTAGSYAGATCEPGDMVIVNTTGTYTTASALAAAVDIIQTNIDTISNSEIDTIVSS